jgi:acyl carrier protein
MSDEILQKVTEILGQFEVDPADVSEGATFDGLGLDSLDVVELSVKIEDEFSLDIDEDDLKDVATVGDAVALVQKKLAAKA